MYVRHTNRDTFQSTEITFLVCVFILFYIILFLMNHTETLKRVLREYHNRISALEDKKFDIEYVVKKKDFEVLLREQQLREGLRDVQYDNAALTIQ